MRDALSSTGETFWRHCQGIISPLVLEYGFTLDHADKAGAIGSARYSNGDRWIELVVSTAPQDHPGDVNMFFGIGPASWPDRKKVAVPLKAYLDARPAGECLVTLSHADDVKTTVEKMSQLLRDCASDFLRGDTTTYKSALAKHRF